VMVRLSEKQFALLENKSEKASPQGKRRPRTQREKAALPENQIERAICDVLSANGYVNLRMHVGLFRGWHGTSIVRVGEVGMPDWLSLCPISGAGGPRRVKAIWWECKAPGRKPRPEQLEWLDRHHRCGFTTAWFNQFDDDDRTDPEHSHVFITWFRWFTAHGRDR
jgi:hypothetical protein